MDFIEKEFKAKQYELMDKYDEYFMKEKSYKKELKEIIAKRQQVTEIIESCEWYGYVVYYLRFTIERLF